MQGKYRERFAIAEKSERNGDTATTREKILSFFDEHAACFHCLATSVHIFADSIRINGKIYTADSDFSIARAIAVKGDRIIYVGDNIGINKFKI